MMLWQYIAKIFIMVDDVVTALKEVDPKIIINVSKSEKYVGRFYNAPL